MKVATPTMTARCRPSVPLPSFDMPQRSPLHAQNRVAAIDGTMPPCQQRPEPPATNAVNIAHAEYQAELLLLKLATPLICFIWRA
jgi:hypothetical protein